jgi:CheY-like chemotaxis protein
VDDIETLLRRTLGELVELETSLSPELAAVEADPGQLEQVLVNLVVNARDAMPRGGRLIIETANVIVDDEFSRMHPSTSPGHYVRLSVSDTGEGMTPEVLAHALEPFYTTKPQGSGTGLGLATVYGIVTDADGALSLYSQPGIGTTIKVYLPASAQPASASRQAAAPPPRKGRGERILIVEDETELRLISERILTGAGYAVTSAANGREAIEHLASGAAVDLLFTDVVMPGTLGPELVEEALAIRPGLRVVYTSGYLHQVLGRQQAANHTFALVEKPFTADTLLRMIAATLDGPVAAPVGET